MLRKVHTLKGLNLRDSDINRPPEYASDARNVEKNSQGEVVKRWGVDGDVIDITTINPSTAAPYTGWRAKGGKDADEIAAKTIIDLWEYVGDGSARELLALVDDGLYRLTGNYWREIPNCSNYTPNWTVQTKPVEYNKVLYWNDADGTKDFATAEHLWKYDGGRICRAGSPTPKILSDTFGGVGTGTYYRSILITSDGQGNKTWSAFELLPRVNPTGNVFYAPLTDSYYDGFNQKFGRAIIATLIDALNTDLIIQNTPNGLPHHNFEAGDKVLVKNTKGETRYLEVADPVSDNIINFTLESIGTDSWLYAKGQPVDLTYQTVIASSTDEFFNFKFRSPTVPVDENPNLLNVSDDPTLLEVGYTFAASPSDRDLTNAYDDSYLRALPPKALYWTTFRNHLVCGRQLGAYSETGELISPFATAADNTSITDNIVWSDFPTSTNGSTVETFNPDYVYAVGTSEDGPIAAIHGNDDSLAVHKEEQSYYVAGDFIGVGIQTRKAQTASIGAASQLSIEEMSGGHMYVSPRGVYISAGGQLPVEISDMVEPLFRSSGLITQKYNLKKSNSINDFYSEKIYIFLPYTAGSGGDILVFDYYYKEWWLHDSLDASGGFISINEKIYLSDGTKLFQRNFGTTTDAGSRIDAYYQSGWFDLGEPTLRKKFVRALIMSVSDSEFEVEVSTQCDWINTDIGSDTIEFAENISIVDSSLPRNESNSVRVKFRNSVKKETMVLTAYELEFEVSQTKPKGQV